MGQQQLILVTLCAILVGIAIAVGVLVFQTGNVAATKDAIREDLDVITQHARAYYAKPRSVGGGQYSYLGYILPKRYNETENATYTANVDNNLQITFTGKSKDNPSNSVIAVLRYYRDPLRYSYTNEFDED